MPSEDLRKRIEALNKKPLQNVPDSKGEDSPEISALRRKLKKQTAGSGNRSDTAKTTDSTVAPIGLPQPAAPAEIVYSRSVPARGQAASRGAYAESRDFGPAISLDEAVDGVVTDAPSGPGYYHIEKPAHALESSAVLIHQRFAQLTGHPDGEAVARIVHTCKANRIAPEDVLFLDLETTGLSMTPVFLIGTMECTAGGFLFRQYFARDYSEEISILTAFSERLKNARMVVTFNGKSFDIPFLQNRAIALGVKMAGVHSHLDLLHEARRIYKRELPNCRLQTLENMVCGRCREDDIPGSQIPEAYHEFVRTKNANKIGVILMHNLYDILTMADLMHRMWRRE